MARIDVVFGGRLHIRTCLCIGIVLVFQRSEHSYSQIASFSVLRRFSQDMRDGLEMFCSSTARDTHTVPLYRLQWSASRGHMISSSVYLIFECTRHA